MKTNVFKTNYELTNEEKRICLDLYKKHNGNLYEVVQELWNDPNEKGTTARGRAVRLYWIQQGLKYQIKEVQTPSEKNFELSEQEKSFIKKNYNEDITKKELAKIVWPKESQKNGFYNTNQFAELSKFVDNTFEKINQRDELYTDRYSPPRRLNTLIRRINNIIAKNFDVDRLSMQDKRNLEKLLEYLGSPRFLHVINSYNQKRDRDIFETEYIRSIWDKPDLTNDELNLYVNVCIDYINLENIRSQQQRLSEMFVEAEGKFDLTKNLSDMIKTKSDEFNQCHTRISATIKKLQGDRASRLQNQQQRNASILNLVELFQQEEERKNMIEMAEMQKKAVKDEIDRLESMEEWKARILGISKHEAL